MAMAPKWLSLDQIERRLDVLQTVERLISFAGVSVRASVAQRFDHAVAITARQAVREAERTLRAAAKKAEEAGAAPVEEEVLDLVRTFNSIGPARLAELYRSQLETAEARTDATFADADAVDGST